MSDGNFSAVTEAVSNNSHGIHDTRVLILDFGSQYTQLIARRVREAGVYSEIHPWDMPASELVDFRPCAVILSGGPESVVASRHCRVDETVFTLGVPLLGICYGMQTMAHQLGGSISAGGPREFGHATVRVLDGCALLRDVRGTTGVEQDSLLDVWMSHGDKVEALPPGFRCVASSENAPIAGMADEERRFYGLQFHPEVTHTRQGQSILCRFLHDIAGCHRLWHVSNIVEDIIRQVREQVGDERVLLALSGGVDSSVVAALLHKAIGSQLHCVFVDNGLLRLHEGDELMRTFAAMGLQVSRIDAGEAFLRALDGVSDPERKRHIIGHEFIRIFEAQAQQYQDCTWLAQGTIYPDVVESASARTGKAHTIKSHHNVGGLPSAMRLRLLEPLRELFKDEVRELGLELGLSPAIIHRHPFPGPGLAVRVLGEVRAEYLDLLRKADHIFLQELHSAGLYRELSQAFAVFLPVKSVGVQGDARKHDYVIVLRAVNSVDFMTAEWARLPSDLLARVSNRIINEVDGISRVGYDISSKPPATIEWE